MSPLKNHNLSVMELNIEQKGKQYELGLFLLSLYNALKTPNLKFQLGREVRIADKFDDVVIKYEDSDQENYIFCQVKHLDNCNAVITEEVLLGREKISLSLHDFELSKYFNSYLRILDQFNGTNRVLEKLIIFTNALLEERIRFSLSCKTFNMSKLLELDNSSIENFIKFEENSKISRNLKEIKTDFDVLVELLADCNSKTKNEKKMTLDDTCLKYYHSSLIDERILSIKFGNRGNECSFHEHFQKNVNLSNIARKFRKSILEKSCRSDISNTKWKVVGKFGLKDLTAEIERNITNELKSYLQQNDKNHFEFKAINENWLSYYYLELVDRKIFTIENDSVLKFHNNFINNIDNKYFTEIRNNITVDENRLKQISFIINSNFDQTNYLKAFVKFPNQIQISNGIIKDFLNILEFKVNQPSVEELFKSFENEFKTDDVIKYSLQLLQSITQWIKENGQTESWWLSSEQANELFKILQKKISINKVNVLIEHLNEKLDEKIKKFNLEYTEMIPGFDNFVSNDVKRIFCIKTEQTLLSCIKLRQQINCNLTQFRNNYVFFEYNKIISCKIRNDILEACKDVTIKRIVVSIENLSVHNFFLMQDVLEIVQKERKQLIIIISKIDEILFENYEIEYVEDDNINLCYLKNVSSIGEAFIEFQGRQVILKNLFEDETDLIQFIDVDIFCKILNGQKIAIGNDIITTNGFYINRKFTQPNFKKEILRKGTRADLSVEDLFQNNEKETVVVISGAAGLGKTSVLYEIANFLHKRYLSDWIIRINLNDCTATFQSVLNNKDKIDNTFLCKLLCLEKSQIEYHLIIFALEKIGNLFLLFDALDEICPNYMELVVKFLKILQKTCVKKIIVTTRPNVIKEFENKLHAILKYDLGYLMKEDQKEFLSNEFKVKLNVNLSERMKIYVEEILKTHIQDDTFTSIPLNLKMLSEIYAVKDDSNDWESCEEFLNGNHETPNLLNINFSNIYEKCIEIKLKRHLTEKQKVDITIISNKKILEGDFKKIMEIHKEMAISILFDFEHTKIDGIDLPLQCEFKTDEHNFGVIQYFDQRGLKFVHKTYAEYFQALFIYDYLIGIKKSLMFLEFIVNKCLTRPVFKVIRLFLNCLFSDKTTYDEIDLSKCCYSNNRSLQTTIRENNINILRYLLNSKIRIDNKFSKKLFVGAVETNSFEAAKELTIYQGNLINNNKIVNIIKSNLKKMKYSTALHYAVSNNKDQLTNKLLDKNFLNFQNYYGHTALHITVICENFTILQNLLHHGANVNIQDITGNTPIHWALIIRNFNFTETLLKYNFQPNVHNNNKESYLFLAVKNNWIRIVKRLTNKTDLNTKNICKETPLHVAAKVESIEIVNELLICGSDPNESNNDGQTPLHIATELKSIEIVKKLLRYQADPNKQDITKKTPLHIAVELKSIGIIKELLNHQGDPNIPSNNGYTPLHKAESIDIIRELLNHQADPNKQNSSGETPLHKAVKEQSIELVTELLIHEADPNVPNYWKETPLHIAVGVKSIDIVKELLNYQADLNQQNYVGDTPLHIAAEVKSIGIVKELLHYGADVNKQNCHDEIPLHVAVRVEAIDIVKELGGQPK